MRKIKATILSLLTLTAATALGAAGAFAQKTPLSVQAATTQGEQLIAPSTYEEYLTLFAPSDVAATDTHLAIADGKTLYLLDKSEGVWKKYVHTDDITKLDFGNGRQLYFLDKASKLYQFDLTSFSAEQTGLFCTNFTIHRDTLFYFNVSGVTASISRAPLSDLSNGEELCSVRFFVTALAYWNNEIYFSDAMGHLYSLNLTTKGTPSEIAQIPENVCAIAITDGILCCATSPLEEQPGGFYTYNLSDFGNADGYAPIASYTSGYTALSTKGNEVYLVNGNQIEKYSLTDNAFVDYTVGASSSALNRFDGASELILAANKLFIADDNNDRISVYDTTTGQFTKTIACKLDSPFLASDGETLLVSTSSQAVLYSLNESDYGQPVFILSPDQIESDVIGVAAVYGNYYLLTDNHHCYTLTEGEEGYQYATTLLNVFAEKLTADANGFLYLVNGEGAVYRYTEESFLTQSEKGEKICEGLPESVTKISVDHGGNLYALADNALYRYSPQAEGLYTFHSTTTFDKQLVYGGSNEVASFTFGIEENAVYILYQDNYLTVTDELSLPTVNNISTNGITEGIFGDGQAEFSVVQTFPNSLIVEVDGETLQGATIFPYRSYYRSEQPITALKIGETGNYALLSYRESAASPYKTILIDRNRLTEVDNTEESYPEEKTGYLTNQSKIYKFPAMGLPALGELDKNTQVTIIGEVNGLDCDYYAISYNEQTAYVPKSHLIFFDGTPPTVESITLGDTSGTKKDMWRLAYLLLGSAAICILLDTLILRKKEDD